MTDNTCISCGAIIPEGRHICLSCEQVNDVNSFSPRIITNGDRIRAMTDEELSVFMVIQAMMGAISANGIHEKSFARKVVQAIIDDHDADEDIAEALTWLRQKVDA